MLHSKRCVLENDVIEDFSGTAFSPSEHLKLLWQSYAFANKLNFSFSTASLLARFTVQVTYPGDRQGRSQDNSLEGTMPSRALASDQKGDINPAPCVSTL